ncbi:MAG TPA: endonuclease/exonuclease/phosphatase family protein [Blastococcus sp.]
MTRARTRQQRRRSLLAVWSVLVALLSSCTSAAVQEDRPDTGITVMTRNLYVGTPVGDVFGASTWPELVAAGSRAWATLLASDFPTRAGALADEIVQARPDVVGLQEVTLWRDQIPGDVDTQRSPDATHVAFDFLAILLGELDARGVPYTAVATATNADVEFPRLDPAAGPVDLRLTDRDVLLVRTDLADMFGNPRDGRYTAQFGEPFLVGPATSTRSWTSIDYRPDPTTTVRILNTHLEVGGPVTGTVQQRQGEEFLAVATGSPHPVIALGDFNSPADGSSTPTYRTLTAVLHDAWTSRRPADPGWTCCQAPPLADPVGREFTRIDLVLTSEDWSVPEVARTGDLPFREAPAPLWASDHYGVVAEIDLPGR